MSFEVTYETGQKNIKIVKFKRRKSFYLYIYDSETRKVSYTSLGSDDLEYCQSNWFKSYFSSNETDWNTNEYIL